MDLLTVPVGKGFGNSFTLAKEGEKEDICVQIGLTRRSFAGLVAKTWKSWPTLWTGLPEIPTQALKKIRLVQANFETGCRADDIRLKFSPSTWCLQMDNESMTISFPLGDFVFQAVWGLVRDRDPTIEVGGDGFPSPDEFAH